MLSRKYYKTFAELLGKSANLGEFEFRFLAYLENENTRFSKTRFLEAIQKARAEG